MRAWAFAVALAAGGCGPGLAAQDPHDIARRDLLGAAGDAHALQQMMRDDIVDGGLWFADPQCTAAFPVASDIEPDRFGAFAHCLAELHLQPSPRRDELPDVAVFTYGPGIEIEARVIDEPEGPRLTWIGYEARRDLADALPTISDATLEALRTAGNPSGGLAPDALAALERTSSPGQPALAWLKLCLDTTGQVTSVHPRVATSITAAHVFAAAAGAWRFRPFMAAGHALPACAMVELVYPPSKKPEREVLPTPSPFRDELVIYPEELRRFRVSGNIFIQPDDKTALAIHAASAPRLIGEFELCLDEHGRISSVRMLRSTGFGAYDAELAAGMQSWTYRPYVEDGHALPVCTVERFIYNEPSYGAPQRF